MKIKATFNHNDVYFTACKWNKLSFYSYMFFLFSFLFFVLFPKIFFLGILIYSGICVLYVSINRFYWKTKFYIFQYIIDDVNDIEKNHKVFENGFTFWLRKVFGIEDPN